MIDPTHHDELRQNRIDEAIAEYFEAKDRKQPFDTNAWLNQFPDLRGELSDFLENERAIGATFLMPPPESDQENFDWPDRLENTTTATDINDRRERKAIGSYQLTRLLGTGGMGRVYEAIDSANNRVAVKLLSPRWLNSDDSLQRFKQEGQIASAINHPRCVFVKAADDDAGQPYIVMELMTGRTLKDLCQEHGQLSVRKAITAMIDVLDGLEEAHSHGLVHRDIKPANCYLETNGRVKVGDFGLARSVVTDSELTKTGDFVGTPLFASPEQVKGQSIDIRSDIYSVCATLYFLLTGKAPFAGASATAVIARIVSEDPQPIHELNPQVPERLERVVLRGLQRDRDLRYQTVAELRQAIEPFVSGKQEMTIWGRRLAAHGLDSVLLGSLGGFLGYLIYSHQQISPMISVMTYCTLIIPMLVYYLVFEGWQNASIGKRLLQLQIVDSRTGERPPRWRLAARTFTSFILMGIGSDLLLYLVYPASEPQIWVMRQWAGYFVSNLLLLSPILFFSRGRMLLTDWINHTMVVSRILTSPQQRLAGVAAKYRCPVFAAAGYPEQFGEFTITGLVCSSTSHAVLLGHDANLGREVWLNLRPVSEPELTDVRRACARTTRLRWLMSGRDERWHWDAYLSCQGAPLKHWTAPESPLGWRSACGILRQLVEEIGHSRQDGTAIQIRSLDQIWMDSRGRVVVIDWSLQDGIISESNLDSSEVTQTGFGVSTETKEQTLRTDEIAVLRETGRLALCGVSRPLSDQATPVPAIVPLHAHDLLQSLSVDSKNDGTPLTTSHLLNVLNASASKPETATLESRFLGLGVALFIGSGLFGMMGSLSRLGNFLTMSVISDAFVEVEGAKWLMADENKAHFAVISERIPNFPAIEDVEAWLKRRNGIPEKWKTEYQRRLNAMATLTRLALVDPALPQGLESQFASVKFEWKNDKLIAVNWPHNQGETGVDFKLIPKMIRAKPDADPFEFLRRPLVAAILTIVPLVLWVIWLGLSRGGISMWVSGLSVVRSDGRRANWSLHLVRSMIMILPMIFLQISIAWIDLTNVESLWLALALYQALIWLFVVYAIASILPRTPQDWLLGTHLVPC